MRHRNIGAGHHLSGGLWLVRLQHGIAVGRRLGSRRIGLGTTHACDRKSVHGARRPADGRPDDFEHPRGYAVPAGRTPLMSIAAISLLMLAAFVLLIIVL